MGVNIALGLFAAMAVLTSQPYNTEGRNICSKDLHKLQKRAGEDVVLLEGNEVSPDNERRDGDCVEYEAVSPFPNDVVQTTTRNKVPYTVTPVPTSKKPFRKQLCWVYYGKPVKLYLSMRNLPTLPNPQGNKQISGPNTGGMNGSSNTQPRVVCWKLQRSFPQVLPYHNNGGKQGSKGPGSAALAIQVSSNGSSSFYNLLRSYQRVLAVQSPRGSSVSSHCV